MKRFHFGGIFALVCALAACGDSGSQTPTPDAGAMTCRRGFEATVQSGPNAGTMLLGTMVLTPTSATTVTGYVDPGPVSDGGTMAPGQIRQRVPVTGTIAGNQLTLTFTLPDGRTMQGTGTLPGNTWSCPNELTGGLSGPGMGDTGDWRLTITVTVCATYNGTRYCVEASVTL